MTPVVARFNAGDLSELKFDYDTEPCAPVDLQQYYDQFATEMKDAYYDEEKKELVAEKVGFGFDVSYYTQQLAMADPGTKIVIQAEEIQPEVTLAELEKEYFSDVLGSCDSPHTAQAGRTKNLELACKAIDGTILNPGDEFSFNKIVGERTPEKGYQSAIVYQTGGKSEAEARRRRLSGRVHDLYRLPLRRSQGHRARSAYVYRYLCPARYGCDDLLGQSRL